MKRKRGRKEGKERGRKEGRKETGRKLVRDPGKTTSPTTAPPREKYVKYWLHFIITWELGRLSYPIHSSLLSPSSRTLSYHPTEPFLSLSLSLSHTHSFSLSTTASFALSHFLRRSSLSETFPSPTRRQETHASMFVFLCVYTWISEEKIVLGITPPFLAFLRRFTVRACSV